ncbi:MAG: cell division protein FtsZ [Bacteroidales bacterium]|nr:cell division protein FtsZ [Bacteroidales bacterium]
MENLYNMTENIEFENKNINKSIIKAIGVGGGGNNAVKHMFEEGIQGVDFIITNTDMQTITKNPVPNKLHIGEDGLGAGSDPEEGKKAALASKEKIHEMLSNNTRMLFITAGMGGGTGTGASPVIAAIAKELDILTVGIVTIPFSNEGRKRMEQAIDGINELKKNVDSLIIICNDKLRDMYGNLTMSKAFAKADDVLASAARGISYIINHVGTVNVDFKDVRKVMRNSGVALMGYAEAEGENRADEVIKNALSCPLLYDNNIKNAENILLYITSGKNELTMDEFDDINLYIRKETGIKAEIIWGQGIDESLEDDKLSVIFVATGFDTKDISAEMVSKEKTITKTTISIEKPNKEAASITYTEKTEEDNIVLISEKEEKEQTEPKKEQQVQLQLEDEYDNKIEEEENLIIETNNDDNEEGFVLKNSKSETNNENNIIEVQTNNEENNKTNEISELSLINERNKKLKELSEKIRSKNLSELEKEPAYLRKQGALNEITPATETINSKFTMNDDGNNNISFRENNFLNSVVD